MSDLIEKKFLKPKNIEERKLQYERGLKEKQRFLQKVYFSLYDKLSEPERTQAKNNFDIERAINFVIPKTTFDAVIIGFYWPNTPEGLEYWEKIYVNVYSKR